MTNLKIRYTYILPKSKQVLIGMDLRRSPVTYLFRRSAGKSSGNLKRGLDVKRSGVVHTHRHHTNPAVKLPAR